MTAMKCKRHPYEQGAGVCASCLCERLLALLAAQNQLSPENHCRDPTPPVLFPRSVSPYVSRRRSVDSDVHDASDVDGQHHHGFYRTPQVGHHSSEEGKRKGGCRRFPLLSSLFGHHRTEEGEHSGSSSWFSALVHGRWKKMKKKKSPLRRMKSFGAMDRGMSPVRDEETDGNVSESGYSTDSSAGFRRPTTTGRRATAHHRRHDGGFSGFAVCLSPLVRPSPANRRSHAREVAFSGELRSAANPINRHVSGGGGSFGPNRSRKLADRGRFR